MKKLTKPDIKMTVNIILMFVMTAAFVYCITVVWNSMHIALSISLLTIALLLLLIGIISRVKLYDSVFKLTVIALYICVVIMVIYDILVYTGFLARFENYEQLREFINETGGKSEIIFIVAQFLQVTFIPIPSNVVVLIGDELFGPVKAFFLSMVGLILGSMFAFFLGKAFGLKLVTWIAGKEAITKYQQVMKGRDKMLLTLMFMFPMFPDDLLCMIAGLTSMSYGTFFVIMLISRTFAIGGTILSKRSLFMLIPFQGWGIPVWIIICAGLLVLFYYTFKKGDKIEMFMLRMMGKMTGRDLIAEMYPVKRPEGPIDPNVTEDTRIIR